MIRVERSGTSKAVTANLPLPKKKQKKNTKHKLTLIFIFLSHAQAEWVYSISQNVKLFLLKPLDWNKKKKPNMLMSCFVATSALDVVA